MSTLGERAMPSGTVSSVHHVDDFSPGFHHSVAQTPEAPVKVAEGTNDDTVIRAKWVSLFNFTCRGRKFVLVLATILAIASGVMVPALALFSERFSIHLRTSVRVTWLALVLSRMSLHMHSIFLG